MLTDADEEEVDYSDGFDEPGVPGMLGWCFQSLRMLVKGYKVLWAPQITKNQTMFVMKRTSMAIYILTTVPARVSCTLKLLRCASQHSKAVVRRVLLEHLWETEACAQLKSRAKKLEDTISLITQELERVRAEVCECAVLCAAYASPPVAADRPARCGSATPCSRSARCWCATSRACSRQRSWRSSARMQRSRTCAQELPRSSCRRHRPCRLKKASLPVSFSAQQPVTHALFAVAFLYLDCRGQAKAHHAHTALYNFGKQNS